MTCAANGNARMSHSSRGEGEGEREDGSARRVRAILGSEGERTTSEIAAVVPFTTGTIRHTLAGLREDGVVVARVDPGGPRRRLYRLAGTDRCRYAAEGDD